MSLFLNFSASEPTKPGRIGRHFLSIIRESTLKNHKAFPDDGYRKTLGRAPPHFLRVPQEIVQGEKRKPRRTAGLLRRVQRV
jgi:hypothetical protein